MYILFPYNDVGAGGVVFVDGLHHHFGKIQRLKQGTLVLEGEEAFAHLGARTPWRDYHSIQPIGGPALGGHDHSGLGGTVLAPGGVRLYGSGRTDIDYLQIGVVTQGDAGAVEGAADIDAEMFLGVL